MKVNNKVDIKKVNKLLSISSNTVSTNVASAVEMYSKIQWKTVKFTIPAVPAPSHRPRLCGYRVYVPGAAKSQSFFNRSVLPTLHGLFITTPCIVDVDIYSPTPKSFTKTQHILAEMHIIRPWVNTGDVDNFLKSVLDQMQPNEKRGHIGIMANDCLVMSSNAHKYYSDEPRYEVSIKYMEKVPKKLVEILKINDDNHN